MPRWKQAPGPRSKQKSAASYSGPATSTAAATAPWPQPGDLPDTCDPYLTWAVASRWRGEARKAQSRDFQTDKQEIRVLLCAKSAAALRKVSMLAGINIPKVYLDNVPGAIAKRGACFATAFLHPSALTTLLDKKHGVEFELAAAVRDQGGPLKGDAKGYFGQQTDLDIATARETVSKGITAQQKVGQPNNRKDQEIQDAKEPPKGTIAVFDYGCPFLRVQFMDADESSSRIHSLWHQENFKAQDPWTTSSIGRGRILEEDQINCLIKLSRDANQAAEESRIYSGLNYLIDYAHPRRRVFTSTHGAHVLDLAGGNPNPLRPGESDDASKARLVFVQMPEDTAGDSSAASLGACLLDGLRYVLSVTPPEEPLVVNVSFGTTAGPHNGTSLIERAMDELLKLRPRNFAIVLAAGNSRHLGLHCRRTVSDKHSALFRVDVKPGDRTDTFVEFWYSSTVELEFRARLPTGDWCEWVAADNAVDLMDDTGEEVVSSLIHRRSVPNGKKKSMVLLALRPTETPADDDGPLALPGQWEVEVRSPPSASGGASLMVPVDAWIKRDDSRPHSGQVQSTFFGLSRSDSEDTLNGLATGSETIVASGFRWSNGLAVDYASKGPRRADDQLPLIYGLCEWDSIDPGIRASAVRSGETQLMNGTSVAAPVVARQVFNVLVKAGPKGLTKLKLFKELTTLARAKESVLRTD